MGGLLLSPSSGVAGNPVTVLDQGSQLGSSLSPPYNSGYQEGVNSRRGSGGGGTADVTAAGGVAASYVGLRECQTALEGMSLNPASGGEETALKLPAAEVAYLSPDSLKLPDGSPAPGATGADQVRNVAAEIFERTVRTFVSGSKQLVVDKGGQAGTEIPGLYQGFMPNLVTASDKEVFTGPYMREWGSCSSGGIANFANGDHKWFKNDPGGSFQNESVSGGRLANHRCIPAAPIDASPELPPVRGRVVDILMTTMSKIQKEMRAGRVPTPAAFAADGVVDACAPLAEEIKAYRKAIAEHAAGGLTCPPGANPDAKGCTVSAMQALVELQLVPKYAYCTWRSVADRIFEEFRKHCVVSAIDRPAPVRASAGGAALFVLAMLMPALPARADPSITDSVGSQNYGSCGGGFRYAADPGQAKNGALPGRPYHLKFVALDAGAGGAGKSFCYDKSMPNVASVCTPAAGQTDGSTEPLQGAVALYDVGATWDEPHYLPPPERNHLAFMSSGKMFVMKLSQAGALQKAQAVADAAQFPDLCESKCGGKFLDQINGIQKKIDEAAASGVTPGSPEDNANQAAKKSLTDTYNAAVEKCKGTTVKVLVTDVLGEGLKSLTSEGYVLSPGAAEVRNIMAKVEEACTCEMSASGQFGGGAAAEDPAGAQVKALLAQAGGFTSHGATVAKANGDLSTGTEGPGASQGDAAAASAGNLGSFSGARRSATGSNSAAPAAPAVKKTGGAGFGDPGGDAGGGLAGLGGGGTPAAAVSASSSSESSAGGEGDYAGNGAALSDGLAEFLGEDGASADSTGNQEFAGIQDGINPMGSDDPEDYMDRIGAKEDIFKVVEKRYRLKSLAWMTQDSKAPAVKPASPPADH